MMWAALAFMSAALLGCYDFFKKVSLKDNSVIAVLFLNTLFSALLFSPLFLSIPSAATAPALIIVGLLMLEPVKDIPFDDFSESIPAFVCLIMMPVTYSISNGILLGMITYVLMNVICGKFKKLSVSMYILAVLFVLKYIFI